MYDGTVNIHRSAWVMGWFERQGRKGRTEEDEGGVFRPKARRLALLTAFEGIVAELVLLLHPRFHTDNERLLALLRYTSGGQVAHTGHEAVKEGFERVGFEHGGVAIRTRGATLHVDERGNHELLDERDCIFRDWPAAAAIFGLDGGDDGEQKTERKRD